MSNKFSIPYSSTEAVEIIQNKREGHKNHIEKLSALGDKLRDEGKSDEAIKVLQELSEVY